MSRPLQPDIFDAVAGVFAEHQEVCTTNLYRHVQERVPESQPLFERRRPVGKSGQPRSLGARAVRWAQQTLKHRGLIQRVADRRARWRITLEGKKKLCRLERPLALVAFSTRLGLAVWGDCRDAAEGLDEEISLVLTSPPYPIRNGRAYGAVSEQEYVEWLCETIAPYIERLAIGGSLCLNVGNEVFNPGRASRSLYRERLVLALADRFGLEKMDELIWHNPSKPPGPVAWASKKRQQLNAAWEAVYWFTNDAAACQSDNRRVLEPHSSRHQKLIARGGETRTPTWYADGAYRIRPGSFANPTSGRIPRNILVHSHTCRSQGSYKRAARARGLPPHGAPMPLSLARQLLRFLAPEGALVVDPMAGSLTTAKACEIEGRRWLCVEQFWEYLAGGQLRFSGGEMEWRHRMFRRWRAPSVAT